MAKYYKDWKSLYNDVKSDSIDNIVQYILDNTDDERSSHPTKPNVFDPEYRKSVTDWVNKQKEKVSESFDLERLRHLAGTSPAPEKVEDQSRRNMYQIRDTLMESSNSTKNWKVLQSSFGKYRIGDTKSQTWHPNAKTFNSKEEAQSWLDNWKKENTNEDVELEEGKPDYHDTDDPEDPEDYNDDYEHRKDESVTDDKLKSLKDFKVKAVPGLYSFDHFEHPDGSFIQVSPHGHGVYQDVDGKRHEFDNIGQIKHMFQPSDNKPATESELMREWANSVYKQYDDREHYHEQPPGETVDLSLRRYLNADPMKVKIEEDHTEEGMLKEFRKHKGK